MKTIWVGILLLTMTTAALADPPATAPAADKPFSGPVPTAVLTFEAALPDNADLGVQIAEILTARLSAEDALELVERTRLDTVLKEHQLTLTGLVDSDQAAQVGKFVGARLLVTGRAFAMDKDLMIVTKVMSVETSRVVGTLRKVELAKPLSEAVLLLAEDVAALIQRDATKLMPADKPLPDPVAAIKARLGDKRRPSVAVVIPERHLTRAVIDPAVETEVKKVLLECGYRLVDTGRNDLADWARGMFKEHAGPWPAALDQADLVVVGEAFSEFGVRTGDLVTCVGRAEVNLIDRKSGKIVLADRQTRRAVDLGEAAAGKTALQAAGRKLGLAVAATLVDHTSQPPPPARKETP